MCFGGRQKRKWLGSIINRELRAVGLTADRKKHTACLSLVHLHLHSKQFNKGKKSSTFTFLILLHNSYPQMHVHAMQAAAFEYFFLFWCKHSCWQVLLVLHTVMHLDSVAPVEYWEWSNTARIIERAHTSSVIHSKYSFSARWHNANASFRGQVVLFHYCTHWNVSGGWCGILWTHLLQ